MAISVDDWITRIMQAPTREAADTAFARAPRSVLLTVADQLYIEAEGHGMPWLRRAVVDEARAGRDEAPRAQRTRAAR